MRLGHVSTSRDRLSEERYDSVTAGAFAALQLTDNPISISHSVVHTQASV